MTNAFFRAKLLWRMQQFEESLIFLNEALTEKIGKPPFREAKIKDEVLKASLDPNEHFESEVSWLLHDPQILQVRFADVFVQLWELNPTLTTVIWLTNRDFFNSYEYFWNIYSEDENILDIVIDNGFDVHLEYTNCLLQDEFSLITETLVKSARKGILGGEYEGAYGGRATLPKEEIERIPEEQWGSLKNLLLQELPRAYAECPPNFWQILAETEPEEVFKRFLHELFNKSCFDLDVAEIGWQVIMRDYPDYGEAVCYSLEHLLTSNYDPQLLTEIVQVDGGFRTVNNGLEWLQILQKSLNQQNFADLDVMWSGDGKRTKRKITIER